MTRSAGARLHADLTALRGHLQACREPAPAGLGGRLSAALAMETSVDPPAGWTRVRPLARPLAPYLRQAAAILLACLIASGGTAWWMQRSAAGAALSRDVLAAHVRALIQERPVQVASLDTHTVKPWFAGRLDYVDGQRVAALVYRRRLHQISVFVWPAGARPAAYAGKVEGFNVLGWSASGMAYWAVSDLGEDELRALQSLM